MPNLGMTFLAVKSNWCGKKNIAITPINSYIFFEDDRISDAMLGGL